MGSVLRSLIQQPVARWVICQVCTLRSGNRCRKCGCNISAKSYIDVAECPHKFWRNDKELTSLREYTAEGKEFTHEHLKDAIKPKTLPPKLEPLPIVENPQSFRDVPCRARINKVCLHRESEKFQQKVTVQDCAQCPVRRG